LWLCGGVGFVYKRMYKIKKKNTAGIILFLVVILLSFLGQKSFANTQGSTENADLIGWSQEGNSVAYQNSYGHWSMEDTENWAVSYITIKNIQKNRIEAVFQVNKSSNLPTAIDKDEWRRSWYFKNHEYIETYDKARPYSDWVNFTKSHTFNKPAGSSVISPSSRWVISMKASGRLSVHVDIKTSQQLIDGYVTERQIPGTLLQYELTGIKIFEDKGEWPIFIVAKNEKKEIPLGENILRSDKGSASGRSDGYLAVYWGPKEKSVAIDWYWGPLAGGGEFSDILVGALP
jgi:hypothetical protein